MTDASTSVAVAPLVAVLQPLVTAAVMAAFGVLGSWVAYLAAKYLHIQIDQAAIDTVVSKAQTVAGQMIAADANNLAGKSITVGNAQVAAAAASIVAKLPAAMTLSGWDEDRVAKLIVGEIGKLAPPAVAAPAPAKG